MMKRLMIFLALGALNFPALRAEVNLGMFGGYLLDSGGSRAPIDGLVFLVASTGDNSFSAPLSSSTWSIGSTIGGSDDVVVQAFTISNDSGFGAGTFLPNSLSINYANFSGLNAGDKLALYWFPTLNSSNPTITDGTTYGMYRTDSVSEAGKSNSDLWIAPTDGTFLTLNFITRDFENDANLGVEGVDNSFALANLTVIPEPATVAMVMGLVAGSVAVWRRRRPVALS